MITPPPAPPGYKPRCYQCDEETTYLFDDARCGKCTRLTPEEVQGLVPPKHRKKGRR